MHVHPPSKQSTSTTPKESTHRKKVEKDAIQDTTNTTHVNVTRPYIQKKSPPIPSKQYHRKDDVGAIRHDSDVESMTSSAVSSLIHKFDAKQTQNPNQLKSKSQSHSYSYKKQPTAKRSQEEGESHLSTTEEDSIFLDSLARPLTDDEEEENAKKLYKPLTKRNNVSNISDKVAFSEPIIFEEAQHVHPHEQDLDVDYTRDYSNTISTMKERLETSRLSRRSEQTEWTEVDSDTGANDCSAGFFSRLTACNTNLNSKPLTDHCKPSELPMAHLAFMMKKNNRDRDSDTFPNDPSLAAMSEEESTLPPTPAVLVKQQPLGSTPSADSSITFRTYGAGTGMAQHKSFSEAETARSKASQTQYLEAIAKKAALSSLKNSNSNSNININSNKLHSHKDGSGNGDATSQVSQKSSSSEAWQAFLAKKNYNASGKLPSSSRARMSDTDMSKAAERFASSKVEEMMAAMSSQNGSDLDKKKSAHHILESISNPGSSSITAMHAERFLAQREKSAPFRQPQPQSQQQQGGAGAGVSNSKSRDTNIHIHTHTHAPMTRSQNIMRSHSRSKARPEYAEAAEKLAAARVEAMMSQMSGTSLDEGGEI